MNYSWINLDLDLKRRKTRTDGYIWVWCPDHHRAYTEGYDAGWTREHILVYEYFNNQTVGENEVVHHLDSNKKNNTPNNLIKMTNKDHTALHNWLYNYTNLKSTPPEQETRYCEVCMKWLQHNQKHYCSYECSHMRNRRAVRPSLEQLLSELEQASFSEIGRKYGVSDNAIRKWLVGYGMTREEIKGLVDMTKITKRCRKGEYHYAAPKS